MRPTLNEIERLLNEWDNGSDNYYRLFRLVLAALYEQHFAVERNIAMNKREIAEAQQVIDSVRNGEPVGEPLQAAFPDNVWEASAVGTAISQGNYPHASRQTRPAGESVGE